MAPAPNGWNPGLASRDAPVCRCRSSGVMALSRSKNCGISWWFSTSSPHSAFFSAQFSRSL